MRKLLAAAAALLLPSVAFAQLSYQPSGQGPVGNYVTANDPSGNSRKVVLPGVTIMDAAGNEKCTAASPCVTSQAAGTSNTVKIDQTTPGTTNGVQLNSGSTTAGTQATASNLNAQVVGNVASGAADSGFPLKVGCVFNSSQPGPTNGQRVDCQSTGDGSIRMTIVGNGSSTTAGLTNLRVLPYGSASTTGYPLGTAPFQFNGSTQDQEFTCPNSATVNVTAGNTTQIVGLSGSTVIRVCSIAISMSAAGSAGVYTGTGTNCGTGTTALIQDMTLATGTPVAFSAPAGGSIVRSSAGGELCVKAVTGNVTGVVTYAQF